MHIIYHFDNVEKASANKRSYSSGFNTTDQGLNFVLKISQNGVAIIAKIRRMKNAKILKNHLSIQSPNSI